MGKLRIYHAEESPITFKSEGEQIVGQHHKVDSDKIVILCHGFTGNKSEDKRLFVEAARDFTTRGMSALRFDFYGSGDSAGEFEQTLISHNIANLRDAITWAQAQGYKRIAVLGISMGAATAILTVADQPVELLVTWSAVPDMAALYASRAGELHNSTEKQIVEYDGWVLRREFFTDALRYDVQKELARITIPKFIVLGTADAPVFRDGFVRFRDIVAPPADFMEIPDAGHTYQTPAHRSQVIRQTTIWLQRHFL